STSSRRAVLESTRGAHPEGRAPRVAILEARRSAHRRTDLLRAGAAGGRADPAARVAAHRAAAAHGVTAAHSRQGDRIGRRNVDHPLTRARVLVPLGAPRAARALRAIRARHLAAAAALVGEVLHPRLAQEADSSALLEAAPVVDPVRVVVVAAVA